MTKTIQIRDLDDEVYDGLRRRAGDEGISVPELLRREAERVAAQPSIMSWLRSTASSGVTTPSERSPSSDVVESLDEMRGPWHSTDARR